jgi:hypothetical protein
MGCGWQSNDIKNASSEQSLLDKPILLAFLPAASISLYGLLPQAQVLLIHACR